MREVAILALASALALVAVACAASRPWTPARRTVAAKCAACHPVPTAHSISVGEWQTVLDAHTKRVDLSPEHRQLIESHVLAR